MGHISVEALGQLLYDLLKKYDVADDHANIVADVYTRATLRGVGHHDVNDIFGRIEHFKRGETNPTPNLTLTSSFGGMESWNGDNGLGELCTWHVTKRSMALASSHGIGIATIANSNHFLAAAPYAEMADEEGFLTLILSKSPGGISLPGADKNIIGNNPFGYAAGHSSEPILFDICNAYSSYGKMQVMANEHKEVPDYWGNDSKGQPTTDPNEILNSGLYMPMGLHKGFGMAIMVELFTAILSGGNILNQSEADTSMAGNYSQTALSIDISKLMPLQDYEDRVRTMVSIFRTLYPDIYIPGERSAKTKSMISKTNTIELDDLLLQRLKAQC